MAWQCGECGERHENQSPPCPACGADSPVERPDGEAAADQQYGFVWACSECGRHHQKNSPPCKRCGNVHLERQRPDYSDLETPGSTSYLDALEWRYALGYLAVAAFIVLVALSTIGVISVPFLDGPTPPGAPGDAEGHDNVSLSAVEDAYVVALNSRRAAVEAGGLSVDASLDDVATAYNQRRVRAAVGNDGDPDIRDIYDRYEPTCEVTPVYRTGTDPGSEVFGATGGSGTSDIPARLGIAPPDGDSALLLDRFSAVGVDVHVAPDGTVYSTVIVC